MSRTVAIVQARMGSSRLPGQVLRPLGGRPMLAQVLRRLRACRRLDAIAVATSDRAGDDAVVALARREGVQVCRGSETDVLGRYVLAARATRADRVVRVTADCPLIDPEIVDRVVAALDADTDYAANVLQRTFPRGLDAEAVHTDTLARLDRLARSRPAREHVTWLVHERPELFATRSVTHRGASCADLRWTVDTAADLALVETLYEALGLSEHLVSWSVVAAYVRAHPSISSLNASVTQKAS